MFDRILKEVILPNEGGYVNNPNDRGGPTNFGITQATYDKWNKKNSDETQTVKLIALDEVRLIYFSFWTKARCDLLFDYAPALTVQHFDFLVNAGYERKGTDAAEILQRTIDWYNPITVDGYIGPETFGALVSYVRKFPTSADKFFHAEYVLRRKQYYNNIDIKNSSQQEFLSGWNKRVENTNKWIAKNIFMNPYIA